jgi:ABC-2 type transport system ATP-binding protein
VDLAQDYEDVPVDGAEIVEREGSRVVYRFDGNSVTASALIGRLSARYQIRDLQVREPEVEDTVRRIYEGRLLEE